MAVWIMYSKIWKHRRTDEQIHRHGGWNGYLDDWRVPEYYKNMDSLEGNHFESPLHTQFILERKKWEK